MKFVNQQKRAASSYVRYNEGLRYYLVKVFNYMAAALGVTGVVAFLIASSPTLISAIFGTPLQWVVLFAPVIFVFFVFPRIMSMTLQNAQVSLWIFAVLMGLSLSSIFLAYTGGSIARAFFISASMFGAMAVYGNTTDKDLSSWGSFLIMGVVGLIIAGIVNIFLQSSAVHFAVSFLGVVIFTGLTAYDSQKIKDAYYHFNDGTTTTSGKFAVLGAVTLYLDFINIFISLLNLMGERR